MENIQASEKVIGIPRAMSFYNNYPFYFGFFTDLGIKIVLSDITTKQTMSRGSALVVTETCLPIKVYIGHILNLLDKGVDKIFVPSIQSVANKIYNCSKIRGLPDLVRNVIKKDFTMVEATLDKSSKNHGLYDFGQVVHRRCHFVVLYDFGCTFEQTRVQVEDIAGVCLASRGATQDKRKLAV